MESHSTNHLGQPLGPELPDWSPRPQPSGETMVGRFCRLERLNPAVHGDSLEAANALDPEGRMWTYLPYGPFESVAEYRELLDDMSPRTDPLFFAVVDQSNDRAVGVVSYLRIDPNIGNIEVGHLAYSPLLQRSPMATEAMYLMMRHAFELGYRRYEWKCHSLNEPSRAAALRLGFTFEGLFRQATVIKGRSRDTAWFSIIDSEWPVLRDAFQRWLEPANFDEGGRQRKRLAELR